MAQGISRSEFILNLAKKEQMGLFKRKGVLIALSSAVFYGFYTAFMTLGMYVGIWDEWQDPSKTMFSDGALLFLIPALVAALTDTCSAIVSSTMAIIRGRFGDYLRCLKTTPGLVMVVAAIIGGPFASTCYVIGLHLAGPLIIPISALCPAIGAILGRFLFKQPLNLRMILGIAICFSASFMIAYSTVDLGSGDGAGAAESSSLALGLFFGFLAACGWGIEGCICGYGTAIIDPEVAITIRQTTAGISNLFILVPVLCLIFGESYISLVGTALADTESLKFFAMAGFCAYFTFMFWYKGTGMCGAALGMSCNGTFSFWGPFCSWLVLGEIYGLPGQNMPAIAWIAALVMVIGIFTIALNPITMLKNFMAFFEHGNKLKPLNYAILKFFTNVEKGSVDDVIEHLRENYGHYKAFNKKSIIGALMTAQANGLIEEADFELDDRGYLRVYYRAHQDGAETINKYIK